MKSPWPTALLAALALPSCLAFHYEGQEVHLRHDADADRLEIAVVYTGVHDAGPGYTYEALVDDGEAGGEPGIDPGGAGAVDAAARLVADMGAGRRYFLFYDWPLLIDLDARSIEEPVEDPREEDLRRAAVAFGAEVRVDRSGLFVDDGGKLGIVQHWVVPELDAGLKLVNDSINAMLVLNRAAFLASSAESGEATFADLSLATRERWLARAEAGEPWVRAVRGGFELSVPLSSAEFAAALENVVTEAANPDTGARGFFVPVARALSEITHEGDVLVARFLPAEDGWLSFAFERPEWEADGELLAALRARGAPIEVLGRDRARARARAEEAPTGRPDDR